MIDFLEQKGLGERKINYKIRDWLFSRQRYWGAPFPILHKEDGSTLAVNEKDLPVTLPEMEDFKPQPVADDDINPKPPLSRGPDAWKYFEEDGVLYTREFNTMPQWAGSCWYYLRYIDPDNGKQLVNPTKEKYWMNVDLYIGGAEHSVLHLLYARFWHMVLFDIGVVSTEEPFRKLVHQGMILGETEYTMYTTKEGKALSARDVADMTSEKMEQKGIISKRISETDTEKDGDFFVLKNNKSIRVDARSFKMSKSRGNVINPDDIIHKYGADALRLYEMFMGPLEAIKPWSMTGVEGVSRFLNRLWRLLIDEDNGNILDKIQDISADKEQLRELHKAIKKVTEDIENLRFNTAISAMMILVNEAYKWEILPKYVIREFLIILNPFAPHISEEIWQKLGLPDTIAEQTWPEFDESLLQVDEVEWVLQINGKIRDKMITSKDISREEMEKKSLEYGRIPELIDGLTVRKVIVVPGKLVNIVAN